MHFFLDFSFIFLLFFSKFFPQIFLSFILVCLWFQTIWINNLLNQREVFHLFIDEFWWQSSYFLQLRFNFFQNFFESFLLLIFWALLIFGVQNFIHDVFRFNSIHSHESTLKITSFFLNFHIITSIILGINYLIQIKQISSLQKIILQSSF